MQLNETLQALFDILSEVAPDSMSLKEKGDFYKAQQAKAKEYVAAIDKPRRAELKEQIIAYIKIAKPREEVVRDRLYQMQGLMEQDLDHITVNTKPVTATMPYVLWDGHSTAPTAMLRSGLFSNPAPGQHIFKVLGLNHIRIERSGAPLTGTHLQALLYAINLVRDYDQKNGQTVVFNAWQAISTMGWTKSVQSLHRLRNALETLQNTKVRILLDKATDTQESAPLVGRVVSCMEKRAAWEVQLTGTLLSAVAEHYTFLNFETMAALPNGAAFWLYAFIRSEANPRTEWDLDEMADAAGLTSKNRYVTKAKLKAALDILVAGRVETKARGKATHIEGRGTLESRGNRVVVKSLTSTTKKFLPPLKSFEFRKTATGKERVVIYR